MTKVVEVAPDDVLRSIAYRSELSAWLRRLPLSRRDVIEVGSDVLNDHIAWHGKIAMNDGRLIALPPGIFDDVHGEDGSGVWISQQRRNTAPRRRYAKRLLPRLRLYEAIGIIGGRAVTRERQRAELAEMRELIRRFDKIWRARYVNEVRKLRKLYDGKSALLYGCAIRRLRLRFKAERDLWEMQ